MALKYLTATVTQGSNDAYVESSVPTGLGAVGNVAFRVRELYFLLPTLPNTNGADVQVSLHRKTSASMPLVTDRWLVYTHLRVVQFTTSGATIQDRSLRVTFTTDDNLLVVEDPIYFALDSTSTAATNTARVRIGYEQVRISEVDRLSLIAETLTT